MTQDVFHAYIPPTAIKYAEVASRSGRQSAIRCLLMVSKNEYVVARQTLVVRDKHVNELIVTERSIHKHEAENLYEAELVSLEQEGFDVIREEQRMTVKSDLSTLLLNHTFNAIDWSQLNYEQRAACQGISSLPVYSGIQVCIVIDEHLKHAIYPVHYNGVHRKPIDVSPDVVALLDKVKLLKEPQPSVLEGFYSQAHGLTITDGSLINGVDMSNASFSERYDALESIFSVRQNLFRSGLAPARPFSMSMLAKEKGNVEFACAYVLKAQQSSPSVGHSNSHQKLPPVILSNSAATLTSYTIKPDGSARCQGVGENVMRLTLAPFVLKESYFGMSYSLFVTERREPIFFA